MLKNDILNKHDQMWYLNMPIKKNTLCDLSKAKFENSRKNITNKTWWDITITCMENVLVLIKYGMRCLVTRVQSHMPSKLF